jgi:hypothetical protein
LLQEVRIALWEIGPEVKAVDFLRRQARTRDRDKSFADGRDCPTHDLEREHLLHVRVAQLPPAPREFYDLYYQ